jgi:uncharacterized integral membrane protein
MKVKIGKTKKYILLVILLVFIWISASALILLRYSADWPVLLVSGLVASAATAALIYILFFSVVVLDGDFTERKLKKIFRKYGSRLVALNGEFPENATYRYQVKSLEDLVKLSLVAKRPVLYGYEDNTKDITKFCVLDQDVIYYWNPWWYEVDLTNYSEVNEAAEQRPTEYIEF